MNKYKKVKNYVLTCHQKSLKVVLTHGVFDLLHKGHLKTLNESKRYGKILIVGVDSDSLVKQLKGPSRPIIKQNDRLEIIKSINGVDFAFILEPTKLELLKLGIWFKKLYRYLGIDVVTSGNPSEYKIKQKLICDDLSIKYYLAGKRVIETTTEIIKRAKDSPK